MTETDELIREAKYAVGQVVMIVNSDDIGCDEPAMFRYHVGEDKAVVGYAGLGMEIPIRNIRHLSKRERGPSARD